MSRTTRLGVVLGFVHLTAYALSLYFSDGGWQRATIFLLWQIVDLPVSVIVYLSAFTHYWALVRGIFDDTHVWASLLPLIITDAIAGTAWWFMLPRFGVWLEDYYSN